jgi:hypothetical protein
MQFTYCHPSPISWTVSWQIWNDDAIEDAFLSGYHVGLTPFARIEEFLSLTLAAVLDPHHRGRLEKSPSAREQIAGFRILNVNFFPRESHIATFRDPWSFPVLFHPGCNHLIRDHLGDLAQKVHL